MSNSHGLMKASSTASSIKRTKLNTSSQPRTHTTSTHSPAANQARTETSSSYFPSRLNQKKSPIPPKSQLSSSQPQLGQASSQDHPNLHLLLPRPRRAGTRTRPGALRVTTTTTARSRVCRAAGAVVVVRAAVGVRVVVRAVAGPLVSTCFNR